MQNKKSVKIIASILVAGQLLGFPIFAFADILGIQGSNPATPMYVSDAANGTGGVAGITANLTVTAALTGASSANKGCEVSEQAFFGSDTAVSFGAGGLSLISGGSSVVAQLQAKLTTIQTKLIPCRQAILITLDGIIAPNVYTATQKQTLYNSVSAAIASLKAKEEPIKSQLKAAQQGFWKTLVYNILIKTTQSVSSRLLYQLTNNYKIRDFVQYADAVATQVYDNEFIRANASGKLEDQLILRSMVNNPAVQYELMPAVVQRANMALGFEPNGMSVSNPNFYADMAKIGSSPANPYLQQVMLADMAQQSHSRAVMTAQAEIAQSNGLKTPRTCGGTLAQQQSIDRSYIAANNELANRQELLQSLLDAQTAGKKVEARDIERAQADVNTAIKRVQSVPNSVSVAGNAAIDICTAIVSPPSLINQGIQEALHQIGQNLGTYNDNNLPFFINAITSIATQYTDSLIFGGNGASNSQILNEATGVLATGAAMAAGFVGSEAQTKQNSSLILTSTRSDDGSNKNSATYSLQWDASGVADATGVAITGPGMPANSSGVVMAPLVGATTATVAATGSYNYVATAYGKSKADVKATVMMTIVPGKVPQVQGAFISKAPLNIRGPAGVQTRGE